MTDFFSERSIRALALLTCLGELLLSLKQGLDAEVALFTLFLQMALSLAFFLMRFH